MGEPMCRNLAAKSGHAVRAFDLRPAAVAGAQAASSLEDAARGADVVFLSLPGAVQVEGVCAELLRILAPGACVADLSTTPVSLTRNLHGKFGERGIDFADAPVARTREAAQQGTLSVMVGGTAQAFERLRPLLAHVASDIT